jgi:hypothetical protein
MNRKRKLITLREKKQEQQQKRSRTENDDIENNSLIPSDKTCNICYDSITYQGQLDCCTHTFCFECISKWAKDSSICPLCRARFFAISKTVLGTLSSSDGNGHSSCVSSSSTKRVEKIRVPLRDFSHSKFVDDEEYYGTIRQLISEESEVAGFDSDDEPEFNEQDEDEYGNLRGFIVNDDHVDYEPGFSQETARIRTPAAERVRRRHRVVTARPFPSDVDWSDGETESFEYATTTTNARSTTTTTRNNTSVISIHSTPSPPSKKQKEIDAGYESDDKTIELNQDEIEKLISKMFPQCK